MIAPSRSWTDAITNATLLGGFDSARYLAWFEKREIDVNAILPQFLHEWTHHWCFHSLLGNAIALLTLRARRNCLVHGPALRFAIIKNDLLRAQTAEIMLQPFSEGLALFAEFDATPGRSSVSSQTMMAAVVCFGFAVGEGRRDVQLSLLALLQNTRRRPTFLERKAGIYAHAFECEEGYLSGYLSVKALWGALALKVPAFEDRDLFLSFLRSWIYDDPNLVRVLLSDEADEVRACEAAAHYVVRRLAALVERQDLAETVALWEAACARGEPVEGVLGATAQQQADAHERLVGLLSDAAGDGPESQFAVHAFMTLQERKYLTLASLPAKAQVASRAVEIVCSSDAGVRYERTMDLPDGNYEGNLMVVVPSSARFLLVLFATGDQCRVVGAFGREHEADLKEVTRYALNQPVSVSVHEDLEQAADRAVREGALAFVHEYNRENCLRSAESLYGSLATLHADGDAVGGVLERLREGGLLKLLDGDAGLVRGLAAIGLANTLSSDLTTVTGLAEMMGIDRRLIEQTVGSAEVRHGLRLLVRARDSVIALA